MKLIKSSVELIKDKENLPEEHWDLYFSAKYNSERNKHLLSNSFKELFPNEEIRFKLNKHEEIDEPFETVTIPYRKYISKVSKLIKYRIDYNSITNKDKFFNIFEGRLTIKMTDSRRHMDKLFTNILNYDSGLKSINLYRYPFLEDLESNDNLELIVSSSVLDNLKLKEEFEKRLSSLEYKFYKFLSQRLQDDTVDLRGDSEIIPDVYIKSIIYFTGFKDELETLFKSPFCSSALNRMECRDQLFDLLR